MKCIAHLVFIDDRDLHSAALNMAIDEELLASAEPKLRCYRWEKPAVSFGYFGKFPDAQSFANGHELVRRWTGGGIVPHGNDLTYSLVIPRDHSLYVWGAADIYDCVHRALQAALHTTGAPATLAREASTRVSDACFANPVRSDVLSGGRKIAGAAQRRSRRGILQQGSIQLVTLPDDFARRFAQQLADSVVESSLEAQLMARAKMLAQQKYARREWLMRR